MKYVPLIAMLAAGGLFGWFAPDRAGPSAAPPSSASLQSQGPVRQPETAEWHGGEVVLPRGPDGHFYAEVTIDGAPARMLVDTGASVIALSGDDAEALGVSWSPEDVTPVARGAGGAVHGVRVTLDRVQVGDIEVRGVDAVVVPALSLSLLGQSFLSRAGRIEMSGDEMVLGGQDLG